MGGGGVSDGIEAAGGIREGGGSFCSRIFLPGDLRGRSLFAFSFRGGPGGVRHTAPRRMRGLSYPTLEARTS